LSWKTGANSLGFLFVYHYVCLLCAA